jgi:opacity protein-like surface antigen
MLKHISKLMVLVAMSFYVYSPNSNAADLKEKVKAQAKEVVSSAVRSAEREIHKHAIGIGLGQTFLLGQFEKYTYTASYSFDLLINIHSSHHQFAEKEVWLRGYTMSIKARSYEFDAFSPFLLGGLGFYSPQISNNGQESKVKNTFGFNFGAGADLRLNHKMIIGIILQYHKPFEVKQEETADIRGSYAKLLLTAMYLF